jgi:deoxycytidine triphosphate deaminase
VWSKVITSGYNKDHETPVGYDFTWSSVADVVGFGKVGVNSKHLPTYRDIQETGKELWLPEGVYLLDLAEAVAIPAGYAGFVWPRSTLVRCGADLATAIWDAGYTGRGSVGLVVYNHRGIVLESGCRVAHMVLLPMSTATTLYTGQYQGEGL